MEKIIKTVHVEEVWGTAVVLDVRHDSQQQADVDNAILEVVKFVHKVDDDYSPFKPYSFTSLIASGALKPYDAPEQVVKVYDDCVMLRDMTSGAFDPFQTGKGLFNPVAYVKGWATGLASEMLLDAGFENHMVNSGGDIMVRGSSHPGGENTEEGWVVGLQHPYDKENIFGSINLIDSAIATSGLYERGEHIVGAREEISSVSVVGPDAGFADAFSTAIFVGGAELELPEDYDVCVVSGETVLSSSPKFVTS